MDKRHSTKITVTNVLITGAGGPEKHPLSGCAEFSDGRISTFSRRGLGYPFKFGGYRNLQNGGFASFSFKSPAREEALVDYFGRQTPHREKSEKIDRQTGFPVD